MLLSLVLYFTSYIVDKFVSKSLSLEEEEKKHDELIKVQEEKDRKKNESRNTKKSLLFDNYECLESAGKITYLSVEYGVIDNTVYFSRNNTHHLNLKLNDSVVYISYKTSKTGQESTKVIRVLKPYCDDKENEDYKLKNHKINAVRHNISSRVRITKVIERERRHIVVEPNFTINLDKVAINFIPSEGDFIELHENICNTSKNDIETSEEVLEIIEIKYLRYKLGNGKITVWDQEKRCGLVGNDVYFSCQNCDMSKNLSLGDEVTYNAVESEQGKYAWRALSLTSILCPKSNVSAKDAIDYEENKCGIEISKNFNVGKIEMGEKRIIKVEIKNTSLHTHNLMKSIFYSKWSESQFNFLSKHDSCLLIKPNESIFFNFECKAKNYGYSEEKFVFTFKNFKIHRKFKLIVFDPKWDERTDIVNYHTNYNLRKDQMIQKIIDNCVKTKHCIAGVRVIKPPPLIKIKIPCYDIPQILWDMQREFLEMKNSQKVASCKEDVLTIGKYKEMFHTMLFLEEIQTFLAYKRYDTQDAFLKKEGQYLRLELENLYERRPSLQMGDYVKIKNPWNEDAPNYEGVIHKINSDSIMLGFCNQFYREYDGCRLSVEFFFTRGVFHKCHFAIDLAYAHLGTQVLFPSNIIYKEAQVNISEDTSATKWFNECLNHIQKKAVINVLRGVARPLPYILFGPPGTGKTVTLVEIIMQIIKQIPSSRLLIATPSNSAANLITKRLIDIGNYPPGFLLRLLSYNMVANNKVPENIEKYCATVDIAIENSTKPIAYECEGIRIGQKKSYIGRHRITIGTCVSFASLTKMGFPTGHFTHVLVDEASQCTEPEIMIPLTFVNSNSGQIVLSGDPMQLGPVILSNLASKKGFNISYMERLMNFVSYKRDIEGNGTENSGYNSCLITKLEYNYRSLQNIIDLSSRLFYSDSLVSQIDSNTVWVKKYWNRLKSIVELDENPGKIFHGIRGTNYRGKNTPSWYNPQEASAVVSFLFQLYNMDFEPDDIGVITPYVQQVHCINSLIKNKNIKAPKIGSVEEFQGQERKIVMISTVRSQQTYLVSDIERNLGFIGLPKRINVALTRAQILLIIFGDPHLLANDPLWCTIISESVRKGSYRGCNLPSVIEES